MVGGGRGGAPGDSRGRFLVGIGIRGRKLNGGCFVDLVVFLIRLILPSEGNDMGIPQSTSLSGWLLLRLPEGNRESESHRGQYEIDVLNVTARLPPHHQQNNGRD